MKGYHRPAPFVIAKEFNQGSLEIAIDDFDSGKISVIEFHGKLASAGIVYVSVHIPNRKIYYLSQDGQFYLEHF